MLGEKNTNDGLYNISIQNSHYYLKLKNCFVSTSGTSVQGVKIDVVTYSHIINPFTGSAINNYDTVIVVSGKGYYGDVMSTSMMFNTIDEIKELETEHNIKVVAFKDHMVVYKNEGITLYDREG